MNSFESGPTDRPLAGVRVEPPQAHEDHADTGIRTEQLRRDRKLITQLPTGIAGRFRFETLE